MKKTFFISLSILFLFTSCGGSTPEQDRERHEKAEQIRSRKRIDDNNKKAMDNLRDKTDSGRR